MDNIVKKLGTELDNEQKVINTFLVQLEIENKKKIAALQISFEKAIMVEVYAFLKKRKRFAKYLGQTVWQFPSIPNPDQPGARTKTLLDLFREVVYQGIIHGNGCFSFPTKRFNRKDFSDFMDMLKKIGVRPEAPIGHKQQLIYFDLAFKYIGEESQEDYHPYRFFFR